MQVERQSHMDLDTVFTVDQALNSLLGESGLDFAVF